MNGAKKWRTSYSGLSPGSHFADSRTTERPREEAYKLSRDSPECLVSAYLPLHTTHTANLAKLLRFAFDPCSSSGLHDHLKNATNSMRR